MLVFIKLSIVNEYNIKTYMICISCGTTLALFEMLKSRQNKRKYYNTKGMTNLIQNENFQS